MRKLYVKRIRALACFGLYYHCVIGQTVRDHLAWAGGRDRKELMLQEDACTLVNGGLCCLQIPESAVSLFVIAYREHSELMTETVTIPAGETDVFYEVETIYNGARQLELKLREKLEKIQVNGICLHYAAAGTGSPVILVHGNGEDHHLFDTEIGQLTRAGYRVYAPDSRGHGASEPVEVFHYADMAEDIFQMIRALGLEKPAYYGHSDGGIIGLLLEIMHPGTLGLLAVSGTNLSPQGLLPEFLQECRENNEREENPLITLMLTEPHIDPASLEEITIPVLLAAGERDLVLEEETQRIAARLPRACCLVLQGQDHGSYVENSEIMGNLLIDFLKENHY